MYIYLDTWNTKTWCEHRIT